MLQSKTILIVNDNAYEALDLSAMIEDHDGCVAGPVATLAEASNILEFGNVAAALVDCDHVDCESSPVVMLLAERGVPLVIQTSNGLPRALEFLGGRISILAKPVDPRRVINSLMIAIEQQVSIHGADKLEFFPEQV